MFERLIFLCIQNQQQKDFARYSTKICPNLNTVYQSTDNIKGNL